MDDLISRADLLNETVNKNSIWNKITDAKGRNLEEIIAELPTYSAEQESPCNTCTLDCDTTCEIYYEWCHDCKEYDTENHCCHRYSSFIRETLQDNIDAVLEDIKTEITHLHEWAFQREFILRIIDKHISRKEQE